MTDQLLRLRGLAVRGALLFVFLGVLGSGSQRTGRMIAIRGQADVTAAPLDTVARRRPLRALHGSNR